ncbi:MAG: ATP-dependent helicase [Actinomycetota bacterium]|nr:ATP-dependent helicase [Actinomycetota bacterium]
MRVQSPEELRELTGASYTLSEQQWAAVSSPLEPTVVVAGAGSGKTSLMAARVVYLVANGLVQPHEVLGLTFTTKATAQLRGKVCEALEYAGFGRGAQDGDEEVLEPTVSTYNAFAAGLLLEDGLRIGHEPDTRVMADATRYQLAARAVARHTEPVRQLTDSPRHVIALLLQLEGAMSEHLVATERLREFQADLSVRLAQTPPEGPDMGKLVSAVTRREELLGLVEGYRRLKTELGLMDFSDQIALAARLADEHPEVGAEQRRRFRIVLLDEYQDTSVAQARLLSRLFSGTDPESGRGHPVTAVGDPNQAIYGWRGASVSNIVHFERDFPTFEGTAEPRVYPLTVNRRSDERILAVANRLVQPLLERYAEVGPLEADPDAGPGEVRTIVHPSYDDELCWLAATVAEVHVERQVPWREIGVLTRDNAHAGNIFDSLSAAEIPVEIVGLNGLLRLPEVSEVVAMLTLVGDLAANAELLQVLAGQRWAIGPRDLALLGRRASELAGARAQPRPDDLAEELALAVAGADPTEVPALSDALADPGALAYSAQARERFALLAAELRSLRAHAGEPLLELVRRIVDTCGIDVELASSVSPAARARRDNLDLFVKAVGEFQAIDGDVSLPALLAYLQAEDELGTGLDIATPSEADSVKLLTVHRAKGLEWDSVFLPGMVREKFPHKSLRYQWVSGPAVLPIPLRGDRIDLPELRELSPMGIRQFIADAHAHQQEEELRLGYVALTRPRNLLWVSSYVWAVGRKGPLGPSPYQETVRDAMAAWDAHPDGWLDTPPTGTPNPVFGAGDPVSWPVTEHTAEARRRLVAAERVRAAVDAPDPELDLVERALVSQWDAELGQLLAEARLSHAPLLQVPLPRSLSATSVARLRDDPDRFAADLARPMPRRPSPEARFGTRFHAWVESRFGQQLLLDPEELPGQADAGIDDEDDLRELIKEFEGGLFADRAPRAIEAPFSLVLGAQVVRGRIDAVYDEPDGSCLVVDWKTNQRQTADPLQLAIYRLAWAELQGCPLDKVIAGFYYVRTDSLVVPPQLADRRALEELVTSGRTPDG